MDSCTNIDILLFFTCFNSLQKRSIWWMIKPWFYDLEMCLLWSWYSLIYKIHSYQYYYVQFSLSAFKKLINQWISTDTFSEAGIQFKRKCQDYVYVKWEHWNTNTWTKSLIIYLVLFILGCIMLEVSQHDKAYYSYISKKTLSYIISYTAMLKSYILILPYIHVFWGLVQYKDAMLPV